MDVRNHRIDDIWYRQTPNLSRGTISPTLLVTHYTTGWSGEGSRNWLLGAAGDTANAGTSAHVVIDRDGSAWQIAPFNRRAWHAGPSRFGVLTDINSHSIGLEFVNAGWLKPDGHGGWADYHSTRRTSAQLEEFGGFIEREHPRVGSGSFAWPLFTPEQVATGLTIARAILRKYPIRAIVTHEEIDTRGWKTDPGPAFPQQAFVDLLDAEDLVAGAVTQRFEVGATRLNLRGGPGVNFDTMDPPGHLPRGTVVEVIRQEGGWAFVEVVERPEAIAGLEPGIRGWVNRPYLEGRLG